MTEETTPTSVPADGLSTDTAAESTDAHLGDAGKRALDALRSEVKDLKSRLKAYESEAVQSDSATVEDESSDSTRDAATDVDGQVATTESVKPPKFLGAADGGARAASSKPSIDREQLRTMSPQAIKAALGRGELRHLLNGER